MSNMSNKAELRAVMARYNLTAAITAEILDVSESYVKKWRSEASVLDISDDRLKKLKELFDCYR